MRNRYPGTCYRCGGLVKKGQGHFELQGPDSKQVWLTQHAECAIKYRGTDQGRGVDWNKERMRRTMIAKLDAAKRASDTTKA